MLIIINTTAYNRNRGSSIDVATDYRLDGRGSIPGELRIFSWNFENYKFVNNLAEYLKELYNLGDLGGSGRMILKWISKK